MQTFKKTAVVIALLILLVTLGYTSLQQPKAPNALFTTIKGQEISMASLKGKVVLINFWATDCKSCVAEMPALIETYKQYQNKGLEIIAVAMPYDPPAQVVMFAEQKGLPFPVMHDGYGNITQQFGGVNITPSAYIYNKDGQRIQKTVGTLNFKKLYALLDQELS